MSDASLRSAFDHDALVALGRELKRRGYSFTTVTPATHARVNARAEAARATDLRGVFGWSRPFARGLFDETLFSLATAARVIVESADGLNSLVRWSSLGEDLFVHSAFPTVRENAVFFGPDTYRFACFLARALRDQVHVRMVDVGCGSGAGGVAAVRSVPGFRGELVLSDVNSHALELARVNAELAGIDAHVVLSDVLATVDGDIDLVLANPPYLFDKEQRTYRNGGGALGFDLPLRIVRETAGRLTSGGRLLMYTGAPVVNGVDRFRAAVEPILRESSVSFRYEEIDPDVFGEELDEAAYSSTERIAVVSLDATFG